ncbi:MAG: hypothetical protein NVS3B20_23920 [Polyangiales bacterium]
MMVLSLPLGGAGCASCESAGQRGLSVMGGTVNNPENKSLRRAMLSFGLDRACTEMLKRSTSLREGGETAGSATNPTNGRFFPKTCSQSSAENGDLVIAFQGVGYTYASGVHKVTFEASASVQYDQDFLMQEDVLYGYFRTRAVSKPSVVLKVIESTLPAIANQLTGFGENYAKQLLNERLRDGFTVRRTPSSETDFRSGIVQLGTWPITGYATNGGLSLANDRTEVHEQQRDFIGPLELDDPDKALYVSGKIDGAPAVNVLVVDDATAKAWIDKYLSVANATPPPSPAQQLLVARQNQEFKLKIGGGAKGTYWLVFDNTSTISGGASPPGNFLDDRAAVVSYAVVVGDK